MNTFFHRKCFDDKRVVIVIDEAHCILEWGDEFRPDYSKLVELRAVLPQATTVFFVFRQPFQKKVKLILKNVNLSEIVGFMWKSPLNLIFPSVFLEDLLVPTMQHCHTDTS